MSERIKIPIKDVLRFLGRAVSTTTKAARVVTDTADKLGIGDDDRVPASSGAMLQLQEAVTQLEQDGFILAQAMQRLADDEVQDDARVEAIAQAVDRLNDRIDLVDDMRAHTASVVEHLSRGDKEVSALLEQLGTLGVRIDVLERSQAGAEKELDVLTRQAEMFEQAALADRMRISELERFVEGLPDAPVRITPAIVEPGRVDDDGAQPDVTP